MKISTKWLSNYVSLDGISPEELAKKLTTAGIEVEQIERMAKGDKLVIGEVIQCRPHPESDHLQVCIVNTGSEELEIVCGAPNCKVGIKVIVALVGAKLPGIEIQEAKVRGILSKGMLCSLKELGVPDKYLREDQINGIEILDEAAVVGNKEVLSYLGLDDVILDTSLTPNRADCMAMFSVAKEVGAILKRSVQLPVSKEVKGVVATKLQVESKTDKCPHLLGKIIGSVCVKESPQWMKEQLQAAGIKSINNVVDISNYVMIETGQPLHFYDLSKMKKPELVVRSGVENNFLALDGETYKIEKEDLIIECSEEMIGIAGVMGSEGSKIDENTAAILIEAANFNHVSIRNTSKRLDLITEAAARFSKGLDPLAQEKAMNRAVELLMEYADAMAIEETVEVGDNRYQPIYVEESLTHCNTLLGTKFTMEEVVETLAALDFKPQVSGDTFQVEVPSYRRDILIAQDLDEEIIRLIGFDSLPTTLPKLEMTVGSLSHSQQFKRQLRQTLTGLGVSEIVTYTLVKEAFINDSVMPFGNPVQLMSPISEDRKFIRNSLMQSMMECLSYNQARKANNTNLFEVSSVYQEGAKQERCGILISENLHESRFHQQKIKSDFYALKGIITTWLSKWGFEEDELDFRVNTEDVVHFHPYRSATLYIQNQLIGIFGEIHPQTAQKAEITNCSYGEFVIDHLLSCKTKKTRFETLNRYPSVLRDIALVAKESCLVKEITNVIEETGKELVKSVEVFDVYQGDHIEKGYKSIALTIVYQSKDHTLVEDEIQGVHQQVLEQLKEKLNVVLRS